MANKGMRHRTLYQKTLITQAPIKSGIMVCEWLACFLRRYWPLQVQRV